MIPWGKFKTPLDAYEWARRRAGKNMFYTRYTSPYWYGRIAVWTMTPGGIIKEEFSNRVHS